MSRRGLYSGAALTLFLAISLLCHTAGSKLKAEFVDWDDKEHTLELHGDMFGTSANITLSNGTNLAHISRKLVSATDMVADKQTVGVT